MSVLSTGVLMARPWRASSLSLLPSLCRQPGLAALGAHHLWLCRRLPGLSLSLLLHCPARLPCVSAEPVRTVSPGLQALHPSTEAHAG